MNWPTAQDGVRINQGDKDAVQADAETTLVGETANDDPTRGFTTSFAHIQMVEPVGFDLARVDRLTMQPHVELLTHHVRGKLSVPGGDLRTWSFRSPLQLLCILLMHLPTVR